MKNKIRATLLAACCAGALAAIPATSVAATSHTSPYGSCTGSPYSTCKHIKPKLENTSATGWWKGKFTFGFTLSRAASDAYDLKSFVVTLPKDITWNQKTYKSNIEVSDKYTTKLEGKSTLFISLKSADKTVSFSARSGATIVGKSARNDKNVTVRIAATDSGHKTYDLSYSKKAPKPKHHKK